MDQMYEAPTAFGGASLTFDYRVGPIADSPHREDVRDAMDDTWRYADKMDLVNMTPQPKRR